MDWKLWGRKLWRGAVAAAAVGLVGYLATATEALAKGDHVSPYVVLLAPMVLHALGQVNDLVKHLGD